MLDTEVGFARMEERVAGDKMEVNRFFCGKIYDKECREREKARRRHGLTESWVRVISS